MIYVTNSIIYDFVEELQIAERRVTSGAGAPTEAQHTKFATFGGTKTCPGRVIAVQEARTICALLISNFAITPTAKTDLRIRHNALSATPRGGMVLSLDRLL